MLRRGGSLSGREQNCCYLNPGSQRTRRFADVSHVSGFDASVDGRGLALSDWDRDGDLDIWMSNRTGPRVQFLRNDAQPKRRFVALRLQGTTCNRDAIGARVEVEVEPSMGLLSRTVVAGDAYLSQSSKWLHFGLDQAQRIADVRVRWPGAREFTTVKGVTLDGEFQIVQGETHARRWQPRTINRSITSRDLSKRKSAANKAIIAGRIPLPQLQLRNSGQNMEFLSVGRPTMLILWSADCLHCFEELVHWSQHTEQIHAAGLQVVAISADRETGSDERTQETIAKTQFPYHWAFVSRDELDVIEAYLAYLQQDYQRPLAVPMSLLVDQFGQVAVVYRDKVTVSEVLDDLSKLDAPPDELRNTSLPFAGIWLRPFARPDVIDFASRLSERFGTPKTVAYFEHILRLAEHEPNVTSNTPYAISAVWKGQVLAALSTISLSEGRYEDAAAYSMRAHELLPNDFKPMANLGVALLKLKRPQQALIALNRALQRSPNRPSVLINRATVYNQLGRHQDAIKDWETLLEINPDDGRSRLGAATLAFATGDDQRAARHYEQHLTRNPDSIDTAGALAWLLATSHDVRVRDGHRAFELATKWSNQSGGRDYKALNALAAALAANGDFGEAVTTIDRAISLAQRSGDARAAVSYRARRAMYQEGRPFRRPKPSR